MATRQERIAELASRIAGEFNTLRGEIGDMTQLTTSLQSSIVGAINELDAAIGDLSNLNTTTNSSLVDAINELEFSLGGASIDDLGTSISTTWSSDKINTEIGSAVSGLVDSSPGALDTLNELAAALGNDASFAATVSSELGTRVRFDAAQSLSNTEQSQARGNIDAASGTDIGNTDHDFTTDFNNALT